MPWHSQKTKVHLKMCVDAHFTADFCAFMHIFRRTFCYALL